MTLNSISYDDSIDNISGIETYAVVDITVENIGDESFNAIDIYKPGFGPEGEFEASLNEVLMEIDTTDLDLLEGEIAPGESVSGVHVFGVAEKTDKYLFIIGGSVVFKYSPMPNGKFLIVKLSDYN